MQACLWPFHTTKSWDGPRQSDGSSSTQLCLSLVSTNQLLTSQHVTPVWPQCIFSEPLGERMSLGCSAFFGALLLECMQSQEKRSDVVHQWEIGTDSYIVFDCKDLQHSDQFLAQPYTAVTLKYNSLDWLKYLFKVRYFFPSIKMHNSLYCVVLFFC